MTTQRDPGADRKRHRRVARDCGALIDLLDEFYSSTDMPALNATDREIGSWIGRRGLIARLKTLRTENDTEMPSVYGSR